jgi:tryptophan-rich sensory protein
LLVAAVAGYATSTNISNWYVYLNKPWFNPPNSIFGPVWTVLYLLMGISLFLIWKTTATRARSRALRIFLIQLGLNFAWSFIFFYSRQPGWAFVEIILLWGSIIYMIFLFNGINRVAAYLQVPYLLWVTFAACLNFSIWYLNR